MSGFVARAFTTQVLPKGTAADFLILARQAVRLPGLQEWTPLSVVITNGATGLAKQILEPLPGLHRLLITGIEARFSECPQLHLPRRLCLTLMEVQVGDCQVCLVRANWFPKIGSKITRENNSSESSKREDQLIPLAGLLVVMRYNILCGARRQSKGSVSQD